MREIKYKVQNEKGNWIFCTIWGVNPPLMHEKFKNECEFIGIEDNNHNEIYDNDIVKMIVRTRIGEQKSGMGRNKSTFAIYDDIEQVGIVKWDEIQLKYYIELISGITQYYTHFYQMKASDPPRLGYGSKTVEIGKWRKIEVIGNIFDNQELIENQLTRN